MAVPTVDGCDSDGDNNAGDSTAAVITAAALWLVLSFAIDMTLVL